MQCMMGNTSPITKKGGWGPTSKLHRMVLLSALGLSAIFGITALTQATAHFHPPFSGEAVCSPLSIVVREERLPPGQHTPLPPLEDGDILLTDCAHSFGWRHGHAAMVVDAARGVTVEAITWLAPSELRAAKSWETYPTFIVLRLRGASRVTRSAVATYAAEHLVGVDYWLTGGLLGEKAPESPEGGHCAYLVWYAYQRFGYDLDSDGGRLVTVTDLLNSPLLEAVYRVDGT